MVSPASVVGATVPVLNRKAAKYAKKIKKSLRSSRLCGEEFVTNTQRGDYPNL
jgi:hypothetical protein